MKLINEEILDHELVDQIQNDQAAQKSTYVSIGVNIVLTIFQVVAGFISGSQGLIARWCAFTFRFDC